jgi:hypothetical protein
MIKFSFCYETYRQKCFPSIDLSTKTKLGKHTNSFRSAGTGDKITWMYRKHLPYFMCAGTIYIFGKHNTSPTAWGKYTSISSVFINRYF